MAQGRGNLLLVVIQITIRKFLQGILVTALVSNVGEVES